MELGMKLSNNNKKNNNKKMNSRNQQTTRKSKNKTQKTKKSQVAETHKTRRRTELCVCWRNEMKMLGERRKKKIPNLGATQPKRNNRKNVLLSLLRALALCTTEPQRQFTSYSLSVFPSPSLHYWHTSTFHQFKIKTTSTSATTQRRQWRQGRGRWANRITLTYVK